MEPAALGLQKVLESVELTDPAFPIVANVTAEAVSDAVTARAHLGAQLTSPVKWVASMQCAAQTAGDSVRFIEIGPGKVLSGLLKRIVRGAESQSLGSAQDINGFSEALG
jgi:[acyl-carrier-protein] S-malonyltransferase